jgi:hypothetical protein
MSAVDKEMAGASKTVTAITRRMETTLERMGATDCGVDWCIAALDPFHDSTLKNLDGFPDRTVMKSVVEVVTEAATISCPSSITTGTWESHITSWNWDTSQILDSAFLSQPLPIVISGKTQTASTQPVVYTAATGYSALQTGGVTVSNGASGFVDGTVGF